MLVGLERKCDSQGKENGKEERGQIGHSSTGEYGRRTTGGR